MKIQENLKPEKTTNIKFVQCLIIFICSFSVAIETTNYEMNARDGYNNNSLI